MREQIEGRLAELQREYRAGEEQLRDLVVRETALRETLLRISGAIQVLEELLVARREDGPVAPPPSSADRADAAMHTVG